jgi:hypothetical protein
VTRELNEMLQYAIIAASTFRDIADSSSVPFLRTVAAVSISILTTVQVSPTDPIDIYT